MRFIYMKRLLLLLFFFFSIIPADGKSVTGSRMKINIRNLIMKCKWNDNRGDVFGKIFVGKMDMCMCRCLYWLYSEASISVGRYSERYQSVKKFRPTDLNFDKMFSWQPPIIRNRKRNKVCHVLRDDIPK